MEDGQIVDLFLSRDEAAIQCSSEKYGLRLRALALHIVGETQTAEECENDAWPPGMPFRLMSPGTISTPFWRGLYGILL